MQIASPFLSLRNLCIVFACGLLLSSDLARATAVWQWSVPVPTVDGRRAYLWVPPECKHVRGLVIGVQNMLEQPLFERPAFRAACAENGLGIVLVFPGHDSEPTDDQINRTPPRSYLDFFLNPYFGKGGTDVAHEDAAKGGHDLQQALDDLAAESGYNEIKLAPLMPVGHSSAGSFVWHLYKWDPSRIFATMPFKTGAKDDGPNGIPILMVNSEYFGFANDPSKNVSTNPAEMVRELKARGNGDESLYGYYIDIGSGHCNVSDDSIGVMSLWLKKVVDARIPADAPMDGPVPLKPLKADSGWLIDSTLLGKPEGKPAAYADYKGDPKKAFWYIDQEMAEYVQNHMIEQYAKKPQQLGFVKDGTALTNGTMFFFGPEFLDDQGTFKVEARYIDHLDSASDLYPPDTKLEHIDSPVLYRAVSGGIVQVGPDTFRVCPRDGPLRQQGNPWEPTIVAYNLGDATFRPVDHPAHPYLNIINKDGAAQTLDFPKIPDVSSLNLAPIKLAATASSKLPVEFFVASGPATIEGDTLTFDKIPDHAKFPIRIRVSAFQWGRPTGDKIQSVGPVTQEFFIKQ